ncbi:competence protein ComK [Lederbergia wuyishanensis]|uniref:Competence protein ComK n=1 Tax=Lederbergia wuyishanensis TaxID=1347903 RepID=A0ABU0CYV4_9BACI|nr:competence protein ComK [Lederbergia wuyishanensis]MCJ8005954.1 competence protein ComK [Lederbergia wuyishanensis]MDQ0341319.1 competence protein ComK [Lederbergia wuyishanensis]
MLEQEILLDEYEINPDTMMIRPYIKDNEIYSEVFELDNHFLVREKPLNIVKRGCEYFGSSFQGRREGTKSLITVTHKSPIIIDPYTAIYLIPTLSHTRPECIWLSHDHIVSHNKGSDNNTIIHFRNHQSIEIPISSGSFGNQLSRAAKLRISFQQNIERMEMYSAHSHRSSNMQAAEFKKRYRFIRKK